MNYPDALMTANRIVDRISPECQRIEKAGGIRRKKQDPHDIEIVCIPIFKAPPVEFGQKAPVHKTLLDRCLWEMEQERILTKIKSGDKYKQYSVNPRLLGVNNVFSVNLDLFIVTPPAEFGPQFVIRTGPAEFSHWLVTLRSKGGAMPDDCKMQDGAVWQNGRKLEMPTEKDLFEFLGLKWVQPQDRRPNWNQFK